jgi:hypothetical protein
MNPGLWASLLAQFLQEVLVKKRKLSFFMERQYALCIRRIHNICNNNKHLQHLSGFDRSRLLQDQGQCKTDVQKQLSCFIVHN